jgi:4-amino-4-deoxy-L-arabinose transferase-like glycosyltransferase
VTDKIERHNRLLRIAWWVLAATVLGLTIAIRIRLLGIPLERDEGEYAYAGQLILQGIPPYKLAYNMKFPGTYAAYAIIMSVFGQTIIGIHLGLLFVNIATVALVFFLGRRLLNSTAGITAAAIYSVLSVSPSVLGFAAHATHFVMLPVLGGALLLLRPPNRQSLPRLFASGTLFGIGLLMKQPAVLFVLFGASYLFYRDCRARVGLEKTLAQSAAFSCGAIAPFGIACFFLWRAGVFAKFWFWTIEYARQYGGLVPLTAGMHIFVQVVTSVIGSGWPLWILAGIGLVVCAWNPMMRANASFLIGMLVFAAAAVCPGFYFRPHYFVLLLPTISLLAALAALRISDLLKSHLSAVRLVPFLFFGATLSLPIFQERIFLLSAPVESASRMIYPESPFPESVRVAQYIREHSAPTDTIAVLGSEPQIYFYSQRHSATGYLYTYALMEPQKYAHQMQREMIREIEFAHPKYLIFVGMTDSWLKRSESEQLIFIWAHDYIPEHYSITGLVDLSASAHVHYYFEDVPRPLPQLENYVLICERKF